LNEKDLRQARASAGFEKVSPAIAAQSSGRMGLAATPAQRKRPNRRNIRMDFSARKFCGSWTRSKELRVSGILSDETDCIRAVERDSC
jgi:hypothetical protein